MICFSFLECNGLTCDLVLGPGMSRLGKAWQGTIARRLRLGLRLWLAKNVWFADAEAY